MSTVDSECGPHLPRHPWAGCADNRFRNRWAAKGKKRRKRGYPRATTARVIFLCFPSSPETGRGRPAGSNAYWVRIRSDSYRGSSIRPACLSCHVVTQSIFAVRHQAGTVAGSKWSLYIARRNSCRRWWLWASAGLDGAPVAHNADAALWLVASGTLVRIMARRACGR